MAFHEAWNSAAIKTAARTKVVKEAPNENRREAACNNFMTAGEGREVIPEAERREAVRDPELPAFLDPGSRGAIAPRGRDDEGESTMI
jgi:hypothetical protein